MLKIVEIYFFAEKIRIQMSREKGYGFFESYIGFYSALSSAFFFGEPALFSREMQATIRSVTIKIASQPFSA